MFYHAALGPSAGSCLSIEWLVTQSVSPTAARDSFQIGCRQLLNGDLNTLSLVGVLHAMVEIRNTQDETKNNPELTVCTSFAESYNSPQATTADEVESRFSRGRVRASDASDSSRRKPETTHEVFS